MNHYALYVFPCYAFAFGILGFQIISAVLSYRRFVINLRKQTLNTQQLEDQNE